MNNRSKSHTELTNNYREVKISVAVVIFCTTGFVYPVAMTNLLKMEKSRQVHESVSFKIIVL